VKHQTDGEFLWGVIVETEAYCQTFSGFKAFILSRVLIANQFYAESNSYFDCAIPSDSV